MIPKEKAEELVELMKTRSVKLSDDSRIEWPTAKLHAIIAVRQIIESRIEDKRFDDRLLSTSEYYNQHPMYLTYWLNVIEELENL